MIWSLIPLHYRILAAVLLGLTLLGAGFAAGTSLATTRAEAARAQLVDAQLARLQTEIRRGDALTRQLADAHNRIVVKTVEVIKNVPAVTTGRDCLGPAAVRLLQPGAATAGQPPAGQPAAESAADLAATDRDIAYWIAEANQYYETCATRINALIDWHSIPQP